MLLQEDYTPLPTGIWGEKDFKGGMSGSSAEVESNCRLSPGSPERRGKKEDKDPVAPAYK